MSSVIIDAVPKFAFLALPPPPLPKRKRVAAAATTEALPPPPCFRSISAWAESVLPGTPAPLTPAPLTPVYRHTSPRNPTFRRPAVPARSRCQSFSSTRSRIPSASFLNFADTPTTISAPHVSSPSTTDGKDPKVDLMALGYTSVFVNLPATTPIVQEMYKPKPAADRTSSPPAKTGGGMFKRFQSITQIRRKSSTSKAKIQAKRGKARPSPVVSNYMSVSSKKRVKYAASSPGTAAAVEKKKRGQYAAALPPTIMQEAQLRQVMEGGSLEYNVKKIMEEKAKREGAVKMQTVEGTKIIEGVEDVWRDGEGGIWWDQEEEWEFAHLLGGQAPISACVTTVEEWVPFGDNEMDIESVLSSRRSSHDSDLHESYAMNVDDSMENLRVIARTSGRDSAPASPRKAAVLLALPSRPTRMAKHLRKPLFLLDSFPVPASPRSPYPASPRTTKFLASSGKNVGGVVRRERNRSVVRRGRAPPPPPLQLAPPSPCLKLAINHDGENDGKREFLANSFEPPAKPLAARRAEGFLSVPAPTPGMKKKGSFFESCWTLQEGRAKVMQ
jgi:hypothetical protein